MASKPKSRWADDEADAALEAQRKKEKEEKKRLKAEKARKLEAERQAREAAAAAAAATSTGQQENEGSANGPPAKRRRVSPAPETRQATGTNNPPRLLRFDGGAFGRCRSVENYDKLNDIEEGAYGWVSRARELATGKVVALKRLKIDAKDRGGLPVTGLREIQILKDCDHRNVVRLHEVVVGEDTSKIEKYGLPPAAPLFPSVLVFCYTDGYLFLAQHLPRPRIRRA